MVAWNKGKGPGTVIFVDPASADTVATFSLPGTYELHLTATDGKLSRKDRVKVRVKAGVRPP